MPLKDGEVFAGFVIQRFLGAGGMGEVYLVQHPRLPRLDALKVLPSALTANAEYRHRFNREAELASTLWHSNIVGIHDRGEFNGQLWISMDYVDGTDADRLIKESYPTGMPLLEALEIITAVADALDVAHYGGLLHRDVKPANIMLAKAQGTHRRILLADFGIARQVDEVSGFTGTNMTVGSVGYAAPEQLMGEPIDGRSDQYGLAATAFRLLTGTMPFRDSNPAVVISKQLTTPAPVLSERRPDLAKLDRVLSAALAKDPNQRYPHCLDFADFAEAARPVSAPSPASPRGTQPDVEPPNLPPTGSGARSAVVTPMAAATRPMSVPVGDAQVSGAAAVTQMVSADYDTEPRSAQVVTADVQGQSSIPPGAPAEWRGDLLPHPQLEASAAERDWDIVLTALGNLTAPQQHKALVDEMTALHQAGQWNAVVAAARELARIEAEDCDPGGIVSDARAKMREAELAHRYAQALSHLDQEQWQQAARLLAAIEQEEPGYGDVAALLETAQQNLVETAEVAQRATPPARPIPQTTNPADPRTATPPDFLAVRRRWRTSSRLIAAVSIVFGVALIGGLMVLAVVQGSESSNTSTSTSTSTSTPKATTSAPPAFAPASGPNETIGDYIKKNNIQETTITHGTPGAPKIDIPTPVGWTGIPEGAEAPYGGIVYNTPTDSKDPPKIIAVVVNLTGNVDTDKLLAVAPGAVKNMPGYRGGDGQKSTLSGHPAYQIAGSYAKNGVTRMVAQKTVVIQSNGGAYVLQLKAEGPQADAEALNDVTGVIDQTTTIT